MLVRAVIENFQSHKKTVLEFHPGINIITGPSDSGKSAIRRALEWNFTNRPVGTKFVSDWNKDPDDDKGSPIEPTSVLLEFDDASIERTRKGTKPDDNQYKISGLNLGAIGKDALPPPEVLKAWNINESNFSGQHDPPFLLSIPAGQVAEYLNRSVRLELIDEALTRADVDKRALNKDLKAAEADCKLYLAQVNELRWVDKASELFEAWKAKSAEQTELRQGWDYLNDLLLRLGEVHDEARGKDIQLKAVVPLLQQIEPLIEKRKLAVAEYNELFDLVEGAEKANKQIRAKSAVIDAVDPLLKQIGDALAEQEELSEDAGALGRLLDNLAVAKKQLSRLPDTTAVGKLLKQVEILLEEQGEAKADKKKLSTLLDEIEDQHKALKAKENELMAEQEMLIDSLEGHCPVCWGEYHGEESHG